MSSAHDPPPSPAVRFGYFLVQTRVAHDAAAELTGVLEDLGTGHKRAFSGGDALARLVAEWAARSGHPP